jgi:O-antigen ligase
MPAQLATLVFLAGVLGLLSLDRDRARRVSPALWIPVAWVAIAGSRMVSVWLAMAPEVSTDQYLEGSPLDRLILSGLLAAGVAVLIRRGAESGRFLAWNLPLVLLFAYFGASVLWSEYPDVAFKRWMKAAGDLVMVMVVLTDPDPSAALQRLLARTAFILIPASVLLIKYYPELGRGYNPWTWTSFYTGVATGKNGLGYVCLVFGLASVWRLLAARQQEDESVRRRQRIAHGLVVAMTAWLFWMADSATSLACFLIGVVLLVAASLPRVEPRSRLAPLAASSLVVFAVIALFFDAGGSLVQAMGRDTTLTGRTALWDLLLTMRLDPLFGTGFESFWLGERVERIWAIHWWRPNQAHNGYIELYLNLGIVGVGSIGFVVVRGYRNISRMLSTDPSSAGLRLAYLTAAVVYNLTEAAFKMMHPVWIALLIAVAIVPERCFRRSE